MHIYNSFRYNQLLALYMLSKQCILANRPKRGGTVFHFDRSQDSCQKFGKEHHNVPI